MFDSKYETPMIKEKTYFLVHYRDPTDGKPISIKARKITDSSLGISFIAISDFFFEASGILVNPEEESKKLEFEHVKTLHLSLYSILSITEVGEHHNSLQFKHDKAKLLVLNSEHHEPHGK